MPRLVSCFLILMLANAAAAAVIEVRPDGTGDQPTIQAAIDAADTGDVIELADGTYTGPGNRDLDPAHTIVTVHSASGDPTACVIDCEGSSGSPHRAFRFHSGESADFRVSGITITGGYAAPNGGAVSCSGEASPTFEHCIFADNIASENGGAIYCTGGVQPTFTDCIFTSNSGSYYGGAVRAYSSSPSFTRCHFEFNHCHNGGALSFYRNCTPVITECSFIENDATRGAAIFFFDSVATVTGCTFTDNTCLAEGGGICNIETELTLTSCDFFDNHAEEFGGGVSSGGVGWVRADDCLFVGNSSQRGGAVHGQYTALELTACTMADNRGVLQASGLSIYWSEVTASRLIITGGEITAAVYCEDPAATPVIICSDIVGNAGGDWTGCIAGLLGADGNITEDPRFCDVEAGDFTLHADSPCAVAACGHMGSEPVSCDDATATPQIAVGPGRLLPVFPNPTGGGATLAWNLAHGGNVSVQVVSVRGERLWRTRVIAGEGPGAVFWDGRDAAGRPLAAGLYLVRLEVDGRFAGSDTVVLNR